MDNLSQKQKIVAIIVIAVVVCVIGYYYINSTKDVYNSGYNALNNDEEVIGEEEQEETNNNIEQKTIIVHVAGAVKVQGIVEVNNNARINDVVEEAGGVTEKADLSKVNLAYKVEDGQKIYIPSKEEKDIDIEITSNGAGENVLLDENISSNSSEKININTATAYELENLPGIGASTALKIITYRETTGKFKTIEELKNVSGVGSAKYEAIKDLICI